MRDIFFCIKLMKKDFSKFYDNGMFCFCIKLVKTIYKVLICEYKKHIPCYFLEFVRNHIITTKFHIKINHYVLKKN